MSARGEGPKLFIWVRKTIDWTNEEEFRAQLSAEMRPVVDLWDASFDMPFHLFRDRVREIARLNLSRVEDAECADWEQIPEGSLVAPIDDDDWFAPDLATTLDGIAPHSRAYRWPAAWLEVPIHFGHRLYLLRRKLFPRTPPMWLCTTNNYVVFKSAEDGRRLEGPGDRRLLESHMTASRWFTEHPDELTRVERRLSVANRTLASSTTLLPRGKPIGRGHLIRKLGRYRALSRRAEAAEPAWCRPYVTMMGRLMDELGLTA